MLRQPSSEIENKSPNTTPKVVLEAPENLQNTMPIGDNSEDENDDEDEISAEVEIHSPSPVIPPESIATSRTRREISKPAKYTDMVAFALPIIDDDVPCTYREAVQSKDSAK